MENELTECPRPEKIKPGIENGEKEAETSKSGNEFVTSSKSPENFNDQEGATKLGLNSSKIVPTRGIFTETNEECSQTPLKKRRYELPKENTNINGCAVNSLPATNSQQLPENKEIIKNHFKCRFCSFNANTEVAFTMHLLQHITEQSKVRDKEQDKNVNNSENNCSTSTNSESLKNSISITITAPKNHSGNAKDIKRSIVDEILKKLGFGGEESEAEENANNETRNKEANVELGNSTETKNGTFNNINLETHKNNGETKTGTLLKTYARKSLNKPTPTKPPPYDSFIGATVDSNIDNEAIADSTQLLIDSPITEQLNVELDTSYHILKNVIHAEIDRSDETRYQFVPNNVKQIVDVKTEHSLFTIDTAHDSIPTHHFEPTPARNSITIISNVSIARPYENDSIFKEVDSYANHQSLFDEDDQTYRCYENKVVMPTEANFGQVRDFQCQFCPTKTAPAEKHFRAHYRMHFTKKGIQCPFCTYRSIKSNVLKHLFCHSSSKTFMCPLCHIIKRNKDALIDHLKIAHSKQLFEKHDLVCRSWYCAK